jgi:hypothetical protein
VDSAETPGRYLQHADGSWSFVGPDGWPVTPDEYRAELTAEAATALAPAPGSVIEVEPLSVRDVELRRELDR